jgi:hypothetical protein
MIVEKKLTKQKNQTHKQTIHQKNKTGKVKWYMKKIGNL